MAMSNGILQIFQRKTYIMKLLLFFFCVIERIIRISSPFIFVRKIFKHHIARVVVIGAVRLSSDNQRFRLVRKQEAHTQNQ